MTKNRENSTDECDHTIRRSRTRGCGPDIYAYNQTVQRSHQISLRLLLSAAVSSLSSESDSKAMRKPRGTTRFAGAGADSGADEEASTGDAGRAGAGAGEGADSGAGAGSGAGEDAWQRNVLQRLFTDSLRKDTLVTALEEELAKARAAATDMQEHISPSNDTVDNGPPYDPDRVPAPPPPTPVPAGRGKDPMMPGMLRSDSLSSYSSTSSIWQPEFNDSP